MYILYVLKNLETIVLFGLPSKDQFSSCVIAMQIKLTGCIFELY